MGKKLMSALLAGALALSMCGTALAAGNPVDKVENNKMTIEGYDGASITFTPNSDNSEKLDSIVYTGNLVANNYYVLLMVKGTAEDYKDNLNVNGILFIDQAQAIKGSDGQVSVTFNSVYPSSILDSVLLIAGADGGPTVAAIVDAAFMLGDVNGDGEVDSRDAVVFNRHLAEIAFLPDELKAAADINKDGNVNSLDVVELNRFLAEITNTLG